MSSNMIKGYTLNYDRTTIKRLDLSKSEAFIDRKAQELREHQEAVLEAAQNFGFIPGIAAEQIDDPVEHTVQSYDTLEMDSVTEDEDLPVLMSKADFEGIRAQIQEEMLPQLIAEAEESVRASLVAENQNAASEAKDAADRIIAQALEQAKIQAENEKAAVFAAARQQGYEEGLQQARAEAGSAAEALESKKRELESRYERQVADLEPAFVKILQEYLKKITGQAYENNSDVFLYLLDRGIKNAPKDTDFTVFLSSEDYDRFSSEFDRIIQKYSDRLNIAFAQDSGLPVGEFKLENDNCVIKCGLGTELNGVLNSLELLK